MKGGGTMTKPKKIVIAPLALLLVTILCSNALAGASANYRSKPQVIDNGGGKPTSAEYKVRGSLAQHVLGPSRSPGHIFHAGYLYGAYAHLSPRTNKIVGISRLEGLKPLIPEKDWKKIDDAVQKIDESLTPLWWVGPWHLNEEEEKKNLGGPFEDAAEPLNRVALGGGDPKGSPDLGAKRYGEKVFDCEKIAAVRVKELSRNKKYPPEVIATLVAVAYNIMGADSTLAQVKITEAELSGGDEKKLEKAYKEMEMAEREKGKIKPQYDVAVNHYSKAWLHAVLAEEKGGNKPSNTQMADISQRGPSFALGKPYPNPSRSGSKISYGIATTCRVSIRIYDVSGRVVRTLVDVEMAPGFYQCEWDGKDNQGTRVPSGTYIYRFAALSFTSMRKIVVLH
jgi:hypothetical protein